MPVIVRIADVCVDLGEGFVTVPDCARLDVGDDGVLTEVTGVIKSVGPSRVLMMTPCPSGPAEMLTTPRGDGAEPDQREENSARDEESSAKCYEL